MDNISPCRVFTCLVSVASSLVLHSMQVVKVVGGGSTDKAAFVDDKLIGRRFNYDTHTHIGTLSLPLCSHFRHKDRASDG